MQETNTNIRIPNEEDSSDVIRIEGDPAGVIKVKAELLEMAKKMVRISITWQLLNFASCHRRVKLLYISKGFSP